MPIPTQPAGGSRLSLEVKADGRVLRGLAWPLETGGWMGIPFIGYDHVVVEMTQPWPLKAYAPGEIDATPTLDGPPPARVSKAYRPVYEDVLRALDAVGSAVAAQPVEARRYALGLDAVAEELRRCRVVETARQRVMAVARAEALRQIEADVEAGRLGRLDALERRAAAGRAPETGAATILGPDYFRRVGLGWVGVPLPAGSEESVEAFARAIALGGSLANEDPTGTPEASTASDGSLCKDGTP